MSAFCYFSLTVVWQLLHLFMVLLNTLVGLDRPLLPEYFKAWLFISPISIHSAFNKLFPFGLWEFQYFPSLHELWKSYSNMSKSLNLWVLCLALWHFTLHLLHFLFKQGQKETSIHMVFFFFNIASSSLVKFDANSSYFSLRVVCLASVLPFSKNDLSTSIRKLRQW